jgi:hypothetical protein
VQRRRTEDAEIDSTPERGRGPDTPPARTKQALAAVAENVSVRTLPAHADHRDPGTMISVRSRHHMRISAATPITDPAIALRVPR